MARRCAALGLLCILTTCVACTSGQIGGEVIHNYPTDESFAACEVVSEHPVAADEAGLAFDLAATMAAVDGTRAVEPLTWGEGLPAGTSITPEAGRGTIEIEIEVIQDSAFELEREAMTGIEPAEASGPGGAANQDAEPSCPPLVAFEARVSVTTENAALAGTFDATFVAHSPYLLTAAFEIVPDGESAAFELEIDGGESKTGPARFEFAWADGRLSGSLQGSVSNDESAATFQIARFPSDGCVDGHDLSAESAFVEQAEAFVSGLDRFELDWPDGTSTELALTPDFSPACLGSVSPITVFLPVAYSAESTDGGIDGRWDALAVVSFDDDGDAVGTEVSRADFAVSAAGEFAVDTGITGIAVDDEWPATFRFTLSDQLDAQPATGTLTVLESHPAMCMAAPDQPTDGGGIAPGCEEELIELGSATLTLAD